MSRIMLASELNAFVEKSRSIFEQELKQWVDIPSISADPAFRSDIKRMAEAAAQLLSQKGAQAEVLATAGNPLVYGSFHFGDDVPTVLVYNHLDVQPADGSDWLHDPFSMKVDGERYLGRGTTDDKGPALSVLFAASFMHKNKLPLNIKFLWELEEEIGSPSFEAAIVQYADKLKADSIVVSDTIWISREKPAVGYGLRGLQGACLRLKTGAKDVHSGLVGGVARNPIGELCQIIDRCYDASSGQVKIPGFYDKVRTVSETERKSFVSSGFDLSRFRQDHELLLLRTENNAEALSRLWVQPTFEVHGIVGGYTGSGIKTIVPHQAEAKISMRLVPDQEPAEILALLSGFVKSHNPDIEVIPEGGLKPFLSEPDSAFAKAAMAAMEATFGQTPALVREGGSIGAVVSMQKVLCKHVIFLGLSLPEHGYHAINEYFDWQQAGSGMKLFSDYFERLATLRD